MRHQIILWMFVLLSACSENRDADKGKRWIASSPASDQFCKIDRNGTTIIPNGRLLTPTGKQITVAPHPFGLTISPDGKTVVTANSGTGPFSISIIRDFNGEPQITQIPEGTKPNEELLEAVFMGLAIAPDNKTIYVAGGQENKIHTFDLSTGKKIGAINCSLTDGERDFSDGYIGDLVISKDGSRLYAVDQIGFRLIIADTRTSKILYNIETGRYPFGVMLSPDEKTVYVANVGMFEYSYIKSLDTARLKETALKFPATAYGSREMREGIKNDTLDVPGLGDPNAPESFSVWAIDLNNEKPQVVAKVKTGVLVGEEVEGIAAVGGSAPNSIVASDKYVFVSNGNNDNISVLDIRKNKIVHEIELKLDERLGALKGVIPFGLALSPDQKTLFVAEAGINAVGVIDAKTFKLKGHIPTGWFPSKLQVTPDGKQLIVSNAKGYGSGPNGGKNFSQGPEGNYIGSLMKGTVSVIDIPDDDALKGLSRKVVENNFAFTEVDPQAKLTNPIPPVPLGNESPIKYIVFISKENRTYDQVFGQVKDGDGDSLLAVYGRNVTFSNHKKDKTLKNVTVMPNHLALAEQFTISDNFYVDADVSADGHVWLTNTYPNQWMETHHAAAYGGKRNFKADSKAPGIFGFTGAAGAIFPEDYNQHGSMWDHLFRNNIDFYNFGFGVEFDPGSFADSTFKFGGVRYLVNYPVPGPIFDRTSRMFPTYNTMIPDQFRADVFIREINQKFISQNKDLPSVLTLQLLNDHGAGERPDAGFPFFESYMADNDLALGRVVEFLSHTKFWKNMLIVVTEDDAQGGNDHVDAHRSLLMIISPYAKRNNVSHRHSSFGSIFKTFWNVLGIPHLNQYDFGASDLADCFVDEPDITPYNALAVDKELFDPQKALDPLSETFDWEEAINSSKLDDPEEIQELQKDDGRLKVNH
jgi:DNA-binding beta-propeller fold protein YncE